MKKILISLIILFAFIINYKIYASCDNSELSEIINNYKIEIINEGNVLDKINSSNNIDNQFNYVIALYPYSEKINYQIKDNSGNSYIVKYSNELKTYYFGSNYRDVDKEYTIKMYSNYYTSCDGELLLSKTYTIPKFNTFSLSEYCDNNKNDEMCSPFYDMKGKTNKEIEKIIKSVTSEEKSEGLKRILQFIEKKWYILIISIIIIVLIYIILPKSNKKKVNIR